MTVTRDQRSEVRLNPPPPRHVLGSCEEAAERLHGLVAAGEEEDDGGGGQALQHGDFQV